MSHSKKTKRQCMKTIAEDYFEFYEIFKNKYSEELESKNIGILSNFLENRNNINEFHRKYIQPNSPKVVICGINPGRFGAGQTGIPFIDFDSLSKMLPNIEKKESEKSAKFLFSVIQEFGIENFYQRFHVTNLSWYGFYDLKKGKNVNYDSLPTNIEIYLIDKFVEEMEFVNPEFIIPLSKNVFYELESFKKRNLIKAELGTRLNHPASPIVSKNVNLWKNIYVDTLSKYSNY